MTELFAGSNTQVLWEYLDEFSCATGQPHFTIEELAPGEWGQPEIRY